MSHFIACKNYDERVTTINMGKVYDDTFGSERELIQQQVHKNKRIHFMDQFSHQVNFLICRLCFGVPHALTNLMNLPESAPCAIALIAISNHYQS